MHPPVNFRLHGKANAPNSNNKQPFCSTFYNCGKTSVFSEKIFFVGLDVRLPFNKLGKAT